MAVNIDDVYQRVLALANKEQRGYITPQEFNLFANQAQKEIFEQYFYDVNQFRRIPGNDTVYADVDDMLEEKIQIFEKSDGPVAISSYVGAGGGGINKQLPSNVYRAHRIEVNEKVCEILNTKDFNDCREGGPLMRPSNSRPIANIRGNIIRCVGSNNTAVTPTGFIYFRAPETVNWPYFVVGSKALFDGNSPALVHFELHASEETELVYKILKFAGLSMRRDDIMKAGQGLESAQVSQEKQ